jgi:hypothetical protein
VGPSRGLQRSARDATRRRARSNIAAYAYLLAATRDAPVRDDFALAHPASARVAAWVLGTVAAIAVDDLLDHDDALRDDVAALGARAITRFDRWQG